MRLKCIWGTALSQNPTLKKAVLRYQVVCAYLYIHVDLCMYICTYVYIEKKLLREGKSAIFTRMAGYQRRDL